MNRKWQHGARLDLAKFCSEYGFTMVTVAQLVRYRLETELDQPPACVHSGIMGTAQTGRNYWKKIRCT